MTFFPYHHIRTTNFLMELLGISSKEIVENGFKGTLHTMSN